MTAISEPAPAGPDRLPERASANLPELAGASVPERASANRPERISANLPERAGASLPERTRTGGFTTRSLSHDRGTASCWLCGMRQPISLMVADGGPACPDIRWYCQDAEQCTWRWSGQSR